MKSLIVAIAVLSMAAAPARADLIGKAAQEAAEFVLKKFGLKAVQEGGEVLAGRIASSVARHGDDVIAAVRRVGPKALNLADEAGENAPRVLRLLSHHGDDAARILARPQGMALISRYGDDVAEVLIRHKGIAEPLLEKLGEPAIKAMGAVGAQGGRRLAMMAHGGQLAAIGRTPELLGVIARHGDKAMDFIYRHGVVLAGGAALAAFLANPEPFLDGTNQLVGTVAENAVRPAVEAVGDVALEAAGFARWTLTLVVIALLAGMGWVVHSGVLERPLVKRSIDAVGGKLGGRVLAAFSTKGAK
jgi:hypothetical protein